MLPKNRVSTHPGEILLEEFLRPMGISITKAADAMGIHRVILSDTCHGRRDMSPRVCAIVAKATNTTVEFWLGLQSGHDASKYMLSQDGKNELSKVKKLVTPT